MRFQCEELRVSGDVKHRQCVVNMEAAEVTATVTAEQAFPLFSKAVQFNCGFGRASGQP